MLFKEHATAVTTTWFAFITGNIAVIFSYCAQLKFMLVCFDLYVSLSHKANGAEIVSTKTLNATKQPI